MKARGVGLTNLYNAYHASDDRGPAIAELRNAQIAIDQYVLTAYGWSDVEFGHGFREVADLRENDRIRFTISEPARLEILRRLSKLNRERYAAEQEEADRAAPEAAAAPSRPRGRKARPALTVVQGGLFDADPP